MPPKSHPDKSIRSANDCVPKPRDTGAETIRYAGGQCEVVQRDPENPKICQIRLPYAPHQEIRIIHPFGTPGQTLFLDGEECAIYKHKGEGIYIQKSDGSCWRIIIGRGFAGPPSDALLGAPVAIVRGSLSDKTLSFAAVLEIMQATTASGSPRGFEPALVLYAEYPAVCPVVMSLERVIAIADFPPGEELGSSIKRKFGSLTVEDDFRKIHFDGKKFDLTQRCQARALIRFMCERDVPAVSSATAVSMREMHNYLLGEKLIEAHRTDWRPSQSFPPSIRDLRSAIKCCDKTRGLYHLV